MATGTIERPYAGNSALMPLGTADYFVYSGDFNNFTDIGTYGILSNSIAAAMSNRPCDYAGLLKVYCSNGDGKKAGDTWFYVTQEYTSIYGGVYIRRGTSSSDPTISWGSWTQTPAESSTNYCKMADGTLIQWGTATVAMPTMTQIAASGVYYAPVTLTFPQAFVNTSFDVNGNSKYSTGYQVPFGGVPASANSATVHIYDFYARASGNVVLYYTAVGRWKS